MIHVTVKDNNVELALSEFRRQVRSAGILRELRNREYYRKPSVRKRLKRKNAAIQRRIDAQKKGKRRDDQRIK